MDEIIKDAMNESVLNQACKFYEFEGSDLINLHGFENFVYGFGDYVIRFVHSSHRSYEMVLAEIEFIDYLNNNGASVSTIIHSKMNNISERVVVNDTEYFTVTLFTKAPGAFIKKEEMNEELFYILGREIGKLHRVTKAFKPLHFRNEFDQENYIDLYHKYIPLEDAMIIKKCEEVIIKVKQIPKNNANYGLIHTDLHFGNIYKDNNRLTFFDFDDSSYHYFVSDIAVVLYYYFTFTNKEANRIKKGKVILESLLKGYRECHSISDEMLNHLNDFLKFRETILYLVLIGDDQFSNNNPTMELFISQLRTNILNDIPFFDDLNDLLDLK